LGQATRLLPPGYTGRQVWNRQRTDHDPANRCAVEPTSGVGDLQGYRVVQRRHLHPGHRPTNQPTEPQLIN